MKEGVLAVTVWKNLAYSRQGVSHAKNGIKCQDSVRIFENDDYIVASLADGLGSLKYSEVAAETATGTVNRCCVAVKNFNEQFETASDLAKYILDAVVQDIQDKAIEFGIPLTEMDCTLVFVCILKKAMLAIVGRLGDSAVCVIAESKTIAINDGNKSANGTNTVLDKDAIEHLDIQIFNLEEGNIQGFVLTSDGLENELYMKGSDHVNKIAELYFNVCCMEEDPVSVIEERINKLTEIEDTPFDDDISIAIISRSNREIILPSDPKWLCACGFKNPLQVTYCQQCHKDFSVLYQNIRFREYGGKAAFFTKINKNPEEERRIIGLTAFESVISDSKADAENEVEDSVSESPPAEEQKNVAPETITNVYKKEDDDIDKDSEENTFQKECRAEGRKTVSDEPVAASAKQVKKVVTEDASIIKDDTVGKYFLRQKKFQGDDIKKLIMIGIVILIVLLVSLIIDAKLM